MRPLRIAVYVLSAVAIVGVAYGTSQQQVHHSGAQGSPASWNRFLRAYLYASLDRNAKTIGNLVQFRQELEKIRRQGYAVDDEEAVQGARCVSAPILNSAGAPVAAVSVSGPVTRVTPSLVSALAGAVTSAARVRSYSRWASSTTC